MNRLALGLDFGTESVRALLVDLRGGELASAVVRYRLGQIVEHSPGSEQRLPRDFALQHPADWLESSAKATRRALRKARATGDDVIGIGVDFTSCRRWRKRRRFAEPRRIGSKRVIGSSGS